MPAVCNDLVPPLLAPPCTAKDRSPKFTLPKLVATGVLDNINVLPTRHTSWHQILESRRGTESIFPLAMLSHRSFAEPYTAFQRHWQLWNSAVAVTLVTMALTSRSTNNQSSCHNVNKGLGEARVSVCQRPSWPGPGLPGHC